MPYFTPFYEMQLTLAELAFVQDLALAANYDASNVALGSGVAVADISTQFNGILSTFTIPSYTDIILVILTGWPPNGALRPTVDFTTPTNTTITLTSEVSAPVSGTTGIVLYAPS